MNNNEITFDKIQTTVKDVIGKEALFCLLVGTAATPRFTSDSDIDIAVFWDKSFNYLEDSASIKQDLESRFNREVDLIRLNDIDVIFGIQAVETGRPLFINDDGNFLKWKSEQLSRYPDFKASRAIIEKNILNRKKYV